MNMQVIIGKCAEENNGKVLLVCRLFMEQA